MTAPTPDPDVHALVERRLNERREEDRETRRTMVTLFGLLGGLATVLVSMGVAWGTSNTQLAAIDAKKVDRVEQVKIDAVQDGKIDAVQNAQAAQLQLLMSIKAVVDSTNLRVRQLACDGKPASCR